MNYETYINEKTNKIAYNRFFHVLPKRKLEEFKEEYLQSKQDLDSMFRELGVLDFTERNRMVLETCTDLEQRFKNFERDYLLTHGPTLLFA